MEENKEEYDGVIHINTGGTENTLEFLEKEFETASPREKKYMLKYLNQQRQLFIYRIKELAASVRGTYDILFNRRREIPPATREREEKYKEFLLKGWTIEKIAQEIGLQPRQVNYDLKALGLQRKQRKK